MLRILHLEDSGAGSSLNEEVLAQNGIDARISRTASSAEFKSALSTDAFDLIVASADLPQFNAEDALTAARQKFPEIRFICISKAARPEIAWNLLKAGAHHYYTADQQWQLIAALRLEHERAQLLWRDRGMARLVSAIQELSLARDLNSISSIVRRAARELTGADGATFVLKEKDLCHYADEDAIGPLWKGQRFPITACISGWAMLNRRPAVIENIYADSRIPVDAYRPTFVKSLAMVPIRTEAPIGAIGNYWATRRLPTSEEVNLLQALANTTAVAMENVRVYNELEQRVKDRTAELQTANGQLENANKELEAFSYAVSHDLNAPLRSIRGFTQITLEECEASLNSAAKKHLARVQTSCEHMQALIDNLLRLAKVGWCDVKPETVDLSSLAVEITSELAARSLERTVQIQISPGLSAYGDAALLRIVLENLLSNAWKYTAKQAIPRIEFGKTDNAFFVRDNGAGFNMNHIAKLFQPFQRLHSPQDFSGSGIGLSTVQRVIQKHKGRIWAEGKINQGATFYFTLPSDIASNTSSFGPSLKATPIPLS